MKCFTAVIFTSVEVERGGGGGGERQRKRGGFLHTQPKYREIERERKGRREAAITPIRQLMSNFVLGH